MSANRENVYIRLSVEDAQKATGAIKRFGKDGQDALERIERAARKPSKALTLLDKGVAGTTGKLRHMGQVAAVIDGPLGGVASRFSGMASLISGGGLAMAGFALTMGGLVFGLKKAISVFSEFERANLKTEALLRSTGFASGLTAKQIENLAVAIGRGTLASVEGARKAAGELLTFKSISGDVFKKTLYLAQDLAATGFGTLETNAIQLGKALEDPILGLTALRRVGVSFTDQQRNMIKAMAEAGRTAEAQTEILKILEDQVGGAGKGEAKGLAGAFDTLTENVNLFMEAMGRNPGSLMARAMNLMARDVGRLTDRLYPSKMKQARDLMLEIAELERRPRQIGMFTARNKVIDREIAEKKKQLAALTKDIKAEFDRERDADLGAQAAKARSAEEVQTRKRREAKEKAEKDWNKVLRTVSMMGKRERATADKKATAARVSARASALKRLGTLEDRAAKARLSASGYLLRQKGRENDEIDALEKKGLITAKQHAKARADVVTFYDKKIAAERKKQADKTFGGQAMKQMNSYFDEMSNAGKRAGTFVVGAFKNIEDQLTNFFMGAKLSWTDFTQSLKAGLARLAAQDVISGIGSVLGIGSASAPGGGSIIGSVVSSVGSFISGLFAEGGRIRGPGTGTSDSIIARVSDGEYIVNAAATQRHLGLLQAINESGRGYAMGGLVANDNLPRFRLGGYTGGGREIGGVKGDPDRYSNDRNYSDHPDYVYNEFNAAGQIVDRHGGGFFDRLGTLFGSGIDSGFFGSRAAGAIVSVLGKLIGGIPGLAASTLGNMARAAGTGGLALGTGLGGVAYDLLTGNRTFGGIVDNLTARLGAGRSLASAGRGIGRGGEGSGRALAANDNSATRAAGFALDASGGLANLRNRWAGDYRNVEAAGARVIRGLRHGGRFAAGEEIAVGEDGVEILRTDRPGTITPVNRNTDGTGSFYDAEIAGLLRDLIEENARTRRMLSRAMTQLTAFASSHATQAATRRTAA